MKSQQSGFTLIELIMIIVILGVLAVVAIPKYVDLTEQAYTATAKGTAGAVGSASAMNYAAKLTGGGTPIVALSTCATLDGLMTGNALPTDTAWVTSTQTLDGCTAAGAVDTSCKVKHTSGTTEVTVSIICTGAT